MEGGQKKIIPLDSGLDVKSSDQLVPVDSPLFQHNRQKFQGHVLPTSLRFEHNGFAAGWDVYEFETNYFTVDTEPERFTVMRQQVNANPSYVFRLRIGTTTYAMVYWNGEDSVIAGDLEIEHAEDDISRVTIRGDNDGHEFILEIDMVTGEMAYNDAEWMVVESDWLSATPVSGQTSLSVLDLTSWIEFNAAVVFPEDVVYGSKHIASYYSCVTDGGGTVHTWNDPLIENGWTITYNSDTGEVRVNGSLAEGTFDWSSGTLEITYNTSYEGTIEIAIEGEVFYFQFYGIGISQNQKYITAGATGSYPFELWQVSAGGELSQWPTLSGDRRTYIYGWLPYWIGFRIRQASATSVALSIVSIDVNPDTPISSNLSVYSGSLYYASHSSHVSFYSTDMRGASGQYWEGFKDQTASGKVTFTSTMGTYSPLQGSLTYCCCMFNRVRVKPSSVEGYIYGDLPLDIGTSGKSGVLEENEYQAAWHDSFNAFPVGGDEAVSFEAGYYIQMEEMEDVYSLEAGGGYMYVGEDFPFVMELSVWYMTWEDYNGIFEEAALCWRRNDYPERDFFVSASSGEYVNKDEQDQRVVPYLQLDAEWEETFGPYVENPVDTCVYFKVSEWNDAAGRFNASLEEDAEEEPAGEITAGDYAINLVTEESSEYGRDGTRAWAISSNYVGENQDVRFPDDVIAGLQEETVEDEEGAVTVAYAEGDAYHCMRLEPPYAFYDIEVSAESWPGSRYQLMDGTFSSAGAYCMGLVLNVTSNPYVDPVERVTYYFGDGFGDGDQGHLRPDYGSTELGIEGVDTRAFSSGDDTESAGGYEATLSTEGEALFSGFTLHTYGVDLEPATTKTAVIDSGSASSSASCYTWSRDSVYEAMFLQCMNSLVPTFGSRLIAFLEEHPDATLLSMSNNSIYLDVSEGWFSCTSTTRLCMNLRYSEDAVPAHSEVALAFSGGNTVTYTENGAYDVTDIVAENYSQHPLAAYLLITGAENTKGNVSAYLAVCLKGQFQSEITSVLESGEDMAFTQENFSRAVTVDRSPDSRRLNVSGLYIDRDTVASDGTAASDTTQGSDYCIDLACKQKSIGETGVELQMFFRPRFDSDTGQYDEFHVFQAQGSGDAFIPGHIYTGSLTDVKSGYNMQATALGYTYTTAAITFTVKADVVEFFKANSIAPSWANAQGTHDFYSDVLPSARNILTGTGVTFGSPANDIGVLGVASGAESLNLDFNGVQVQALVSYSQADDEGTTTVELTDGEVTAEYGGHVFTFRLGKASWDSSAQELTLGVSVPLEYPMTCRLPYQFNYDSSFGLSSGGKYVIDGEEYDNVPVGSIALEFSPETMTYAFEAENEYRYYYRQNDDVFTYGITEFEGSKVGDALSVTIEGFEHLEYSFILEGAYRTYKCTLVSFDETNIAVDYDGTRYSFPYAELMTDREPDEMNFMYTDTRDPKAIPDTVTFARQNFEDEYQFLRQAWEVTTAVENYWWVDSSTILELNKTSLVIKKKKEFEDFSEEATVDDWGGDFWEEAASFPRYEYLDNTTVRYGMTSAYGGAAPRFWTIRITSSKKFRITFYFVNEIDYGNYVDYSLESVTSDLQVNVVELGSVLNNPSSLRLNTYSQITTETLVYDAKYSGTVIGEHILFGIHLDNNFNQWALDILSTGEVLQVVQGYGFVGLDGKLTGGEIPYAWFDASLGFSGTVMPLSAIEQEEDLEVSSAAEFTAIDNDGIVVGDESQQWYLSKKVTSIVSHLLWDEEAEMWGAEALYLNNNVSQVYGSASFGANVVSEKGLAYYNFMTELQDAYDSSALSAVISAIGRIGAMYMVYLSPRLTTMLYLQQTMGQYAYVHYNSETPGRQVDQGRVNTTDNRYADEGIQGRGYTAGGTFSDNTPDPNLLDPVTPENQDDFSFNLHTIRQQVYIEKGWSGLGMAVVILLLQGLLSFADTASSSISVNKRRNKMSASDFGREFSQVFLRNIDKMSSMDTNIMGMMPVQNSALTGVLTLDMFYSTCEGQKVSAGPGWVQHNFVAQCVAQSVTSNQMELKQVGIFIPMAEFGTLAFKVGQLVLRYVADAVIDPAAIWASGGDQYGVIGAAAFAIATVAVVTKYAIQLLLDIADMCDKFLRSFTGNRPLAQVLNTATKHFYDMEGKHKYGQKSEVFMWPCWDVVGNLEYTNESVEAVCENDPWTLSVPTGHNGEIGGGSPATSGSIMGLDASTVTYNVGSDITLNFSGDVPYMIANCRGKTETVELPSDMAAVTGSDSFLPPVPFRNENIGVSSPTFPTPPIQDYIIDKEWELSMTCADGYITWVTCKDTKIIDGEPSNIVLTDDFCGVACPYTAIEIQRGYEQKYVRPVAITPNAIGLNQTGLNAAYDEKAYHAFDGYGYRIVKWCGAPGMNKEGVAMQYSFITNDRFKRSNKLAPNTYVGNFKGEPLIALRTLGNDRIFNDVVMDGRGGPVSAGAVGEDRDTRRYALPVFSELVSTLPSVARTISAYNLTVIDGITSLTSDNRDLQSAYKAPVSVDFAIGRDKYRFTDEYICALEQQEGVTVVTERVPTLGLEYLGATPYEAYLYSPATRQYYTFSGGSSLSAVDTLERFRDILHGRYDFVNQEVALPCVATFSRLDKHVFDDEDERDNTIVPRLKNGKIVGEIAPPIETIYNMRSGFKTLSLPSGLCFQGPNRCIINRFVYSDYMKEQILENAGQWERVPRERYHPFRKYEDEYRKFDENVLIQIVGWTHNPFLLVTSPLGVSSEVDCLFEWEITFAWPVEMDEIYKEGQYATVNIMGECFTPGGKVIPDRPVHVFLYRDLFTRTGNYGYYSFRYQSKCGAGNRERLHIWSDQYIAVSGLQVEYKEVTQKRTEILTQAVDVQGMEEF